MKRAAAIILIALIPAALYAQSTTGQDQTSPAQPADSQSAPAAGGTPTQGQPETSATQPVPYTPEEFPLWVNDLRRAEIITIGAFPITLLFSSLGFQIARYIQNGFSQNYAPALLGSGSVPLTTQQKTGIILSGVGISLLIAIVDYGLGKVGSPK